MRATALLLVLLAAAPPPAETMSPDLDAETTRFVRHLETLVPELLDSTEITGVAVGLVYRGEPVWLQGYGLADRTTGRSVTPSTVFNVGSISKTLAAFGVMRLVDSEALDLDAPIERYLGSQAKDPAITTRMLLSHTGGLSLPAVPEYRPSEELPTLDEAIRVDVTLAGRPGEGYSYSGGGYMLLQRLIEESKGSFADYMRTEVFQSLGMHQTDYRWSAELVRSAATPYDGGVRTERFVYLGQAAASLNSSVRDLVRFLAATLADETEPWRLPVSREVLTQMRTPAPNAEQPYGLRYGLGFDLWPLGADDWLAGHNGQNTGWSATLWSRPGTGDGIVVLTNDSQGGDLWKWVHCDWVHWMSGVTWRGYCTGRPEELTAPPAQRRE